MDASGLMAGWFTEVFSPAGQALSLKVDEVLFHKKSKFQDVLVFKSPVYGTVLVLDGYVQCTQRDEFAYQEMMTHIAMFSHPCPKKVLVVGGGDGGVLREVAKHSCVEKVVLCEIDQMVIDVSKEYLPSMAVGFDDPRVEVHVGDGLAFMSEHENEFDVIITDSSDPVGPAEELFKLPYYELVKRALKEDGILASQALDIWTSLRSIVKMVEFCRKIFPSVIYANYSIPTFMTGEIGVLLCSKDVNTDFKNPRRVVSEDEVDRMELKYYNQNTHLGSFLLPEFARKAFAGKVVLKENAGPPLIM